MAMIFPTYWSDFLSRHNLVRKEVSIPEEHDLSGLGADLRLFDAEGARFEAENCYPGIVVVPDGFIPVGCCLVGSGDPYFINRHDDVGGPLYQVYHDAVSHTPYDPKEAISIVLQNYEELLQFVVTQ